MSTETEYSRTDGGARMPRWLALVLATAGTLLAIGVLWSIAPSSCGGGEDWYVGYSDGAGILPGPQPCATGGEGPAIVTAGILLAMLAAVFVVAFTVVMHRGRVLLILGGAMLLVLIVGLIATATSANQPIVYY